MYGGIGGGAKNLLFYLFQVTSLLCVRLSVFMISFIVISLNICGSLSLLVFFHIFNLPCFFIISFLMTTKYVLLQNYFISSIAGVSFTFIISFPISR